MIVSEVPRRGEREASRRPPVGFVSRASSVLTSPSREEPWMLHVFRYLDLVVVIAVLVGTFLATNSNHPGAAGVRAFLEMRVTVKNFLLLMAFGVAMQWCLSAFGLYDAERLAHPSAYLQRLVAASLLGSVPLLIFPLASTTGAFRIETAAFCAVVNVAALISLRAVLWLGAAAPQQTVGAREVLIVGSGIRALRLYDELTSSSVNGDGVRVHGFVDTPNGPPAEAIARRMVGTLDDLETILAHHVIDEVLIALPIKSCYAEIQRSIEICERLGVRAAYLADIFHASLARPSFERTGGISVVRMHVVASDWRLVVKRVVDLGGTAALFILLSPVMAAVALAVKLTSPGPIIFSQERYGFNKRRFRMHKFRTMIVDAEQLQDSLESRNEAVGPVFKIRDDPRVTTVGRFLRRTSLDELPQLWNVLRGDMSLVGPRPLPTRDVHRFSESWLLRRFSVRPGVTGLWQVSGRSELSFSRWVALDLEYIDGWSLGLDLKILAKTLPAVVRGRGAS